MRPDLIFPLFLVVWIVVLIGALLFYGKAKLQTKRRFHPYVIAGSALVFLAFITAIFPASTFVVIVPVVSFISFVHYKVTKFCDACGGTVAQLPPWKPLQKCTKCGAAMKPV